MASCQFLSSRSPPHDRNMIDKNQLKAQGPALGRSLQRAYKIALLYSAEHSAAEGALQLTYASLNARPQCSRR